LPNKFFEYILSGLPVVVNDWPEMGNFVDENECGWKVAESEKAVINLIESISREDIKAKRNNVLKCKDSLGWHKEKEKLLRIYSELIKNC
jgi:glycosyltransferase involved in cell wall biosynthesis